MKIKKITFNNFMENTFIVYDQTKECIIIDPGCYSIEEKEELLSFININQLKPTLLINTHCHIDHIFGNNFVNKKWNTRLVINKLELEILKSAHVVAQSYGFNNYEPSPQPSKYIIEGDIITFGKSELKVLFTPGHAPGHISLYSKKDEFIISGDVLFMNSIGRTDLPGGDYETIIKTIKNKLLTLPKQTKVYCGHGPETTIDNEKNNNPFLRN
ncbi:MAG: MBL fold metallo-hydrolase [Flavobacteriales bacterium]|jgi:hydroxyacylglutathione hydrolase|tara:strand:+ start:9247 stop:9888 length:642 start_codon:yes stop_codon:yes gene_type:complete